MSQTAEALAVLDWALDLRNPQARANAEYLNGLFSGPDPEDPLPQI